MDYLSKHNVQTTMAAGEAHFQNGVVERHIGTFRNTLGNLRNDVGDKTLADNFQHFVTKTCLVNKKQNGKYGGYSPTQWLTGRTHNFLDKDDMNPVSEEDLPGLGAHLNQRAKIAAAFYQAEAKPSLSRRFVQENDTLSNLPLGRLSTSIAKVKDRSRSDTEALPELRWLRKVLHREERRP